jgi:transcriptional regulator with GAF, ATPase, and Fis domain
VLYFKAFFPGMVLANSHHQEITMNTLRDKVTEMEKEEILRALNESDWVMARAAKKLGITERMIGYKIKKYNIRREFRGLPETYRHS